MGEVFWDCQAVEKGESVCAVNFDPLMNDLENHVLNKFLGDPANVLDLGCGNGNTVKCLAENHPLTSFLGVDKSGEMIKVAKDSCKGLDNVAFKCYDVTKGLGFVDECFNIVLTKRLLINIMDDDKKVRLLDDISSVINPFYGKYFMMECFIEPLDSINAVRFILGMDEIKVHSFNKYLSQSFFDDIKRFFQVEQIIDFNSLYYFTSRVYNGREGFSYFDEINKQAVKITKCFSNVLGGFSPEMFYILRGSDKDLRVDLGSLKVKPIPLFNRYRNFKTIVDKLNEVVDVVNRMNGDGAL